VLELSIENYNIDEFLLNNSHQLFTSQIGQLWGIGSNVYLVSVKPAKETYEPNSPNPVANKKQGYVCV